MMAAISSSYWRWQRVAGAVILVAVAFFGILGPYLISADPIAQDLSNTLRPPTFEAVLGTDHLGRNMIARLAAAANLSLVLAIISVLSAAIPGTILGVCAAWRGGWIERILLVLADTILALPGLLLVLLLAATVPDAFWPLYLGLSLALWVEYFRVVRATSKAILAGPQVEASRLLGFGPVYIVKRHLLPEILPILLTLMTYAMATVVLALAALGFISVGVRPPTAELGLMMTELLPYYREAPWLIASPIILLTLTVLSFALLAGERPAR